MQGLAELVHVAMDAGVQRIVHTSSITVYGHHLHGIITEDDPLTTYGVTLLGGDQMFSSGKARYELRYAPEFEVSRGVAEGVKWYIVARKGNKECGSVALGHS